VIKIIYLLRHGATEKPGVLLGQCNAALSEQGRGQARETARQLAAEPIERIVSSTLLRARETAAILAGRLGITAEADAAWNEISYGQWDGLSWNQIEQLDPQTARKKSGDWWSATPAGGESGEAFARRVEQAWRALLAHAARSTLLVAHEAVNAMLTDLARQQPSGDNREWHPDWSRVSSFHQEPGAWCRVTVRAE
jgi:broad specificity phosphatase PhoE